MNDSSRTNIDISGEGRHTFFAIANERDVQIRVDWWIGMTVDPTLLTNEQEIQAQVYIVDDAQPEKPFSGFPKISISGNHMTGVEVSTSTGSYGVRNDGMNRTHALTQLAFRLAEEIDSGQIDTEGDRVITGIPTIATLQGIYGVGDEVRILDVTDEAREVWERNLSAV